MTEKKETVRKTATAKAATEKKAAPRRSTAKKVVFEINAETAGDVYQALATAEKALSVDEIAKAAKIEKEEALLGMGWLFKEGKIKAEDNKITLA